MTEADAAMRIEEEMCGSTTESSAVTIIQSPISRSPTAIAEFYLETELFLFILGSGGLLYREM